MRLLSLALVGGMALGATTVTTEALAAINPASSSSSMPRPPVAATTSATTSVPLQALGTMPTTTGETTFATFDAVRTTRAVTRSSRRGRTTRLRRPTRGSIGNWSPVPGHPSYRMFDFSGDPNAGSFGQCTWYAWYRHQGLPLLQLGNAAAWPAHAARLGLRVSSQPVVGATVIFAPGVQGASAMGHAGVVEQVLGGGWLEISEMNFYWNGGGWGRVDYRYVHVGPGVSFIF